MRRISKDRQIAIYQAMDACQSERESIESLVDQFNVFLGEWREKFKDAVEMYNEKLGGFRDIYNEIAEEGREYQSERSEKWSESEVGQEYNQWIDSMENLDAEEIEVGFPDDLEQPDFPNWQEDEWLPSTAPGEEE
jgi:hypothetical protein